MAARRRTWATGLVAAVSFSILALYLATAGVAPGDVVVAVARVPLPFLAGAILLSLAELTLRGLRLQRIVKHMDRPVPMSRILTAQLVGMFAGNISPSRMAEPLKALVLKRDGVPVPVGVVATVFERLLDLVVLALMLALAIAVTVPGLLPFSFALAWVLAGIFAAVYVAIIVLLSRGALHRLALKLAGRFATLMRFTYMLKEVSLGKRGYALRSAEWAAWSLAILVTDVAILQVLFWGYGVDVAFLLIVGLLAVATLGGVASQAPGGLGATEAILVALFANIGVSATIALGVTLLARLFTFYLFTVVGWILTVRAGLSWADADAAA